MARIAEEMGVEILLDEPVDEVLMDCGHAVGIRTSKRRLQADSVIINADFAAAMERMVPDYHRKRWTNRRIASKRFSQINRGRIIESIVPL